MRVLVVEDGPGQRELLLAQLEDTGLDLDVTAVASGEEALRLLAGTRFDVVVLDLLLEGMDGHQTLRAIRAGPAPDVPVLVLSALETDEVVVQAIRDGADVYITKSMLGAPGGIGRFLEDFLDAHGPVC